MCRLLFRLTFVAGLTLAVGLSVIAAEPELPSTTAARRDHEKATLGERIYRRGVLPTGQPLRATLQGDVTIEGTQVVCGSCHGRSGLGTGEGKVFMPPITGTTLYQPREIRRKELYASRTLRPAYTDETLARAIRGGIDPAGRVFDAMMPRYALSDAELEPLIRYLKSLSSRFSPGVTDTHIHFATVVTEGVQSSKRQAMLDVLETFFRTKNAETRRETKRVDHGPYYRAWRDQAYRKWVLHVWELTGPSGSWRTQLNAYYREQPVFALISGIGTGSWGPVHEFCQENEVPCLLPNTDLPVISETNYYSLYFSKGMTLEAEVLAKHLRDEAPSGRVVQVYRRDERSVAAAAALRRRLDSYGITDVQDRRVNGNEEITAAFWRDLPKQNGSSSLVLWLGNTDLRDLDGLTGPASDPERIYLSSTLLGAPPHSIPKNLQEKIYRVHRFDLPEDAARRFRRINVWLRNKRIAVSDERLQANTLFTLTVVAQALKHIGSNFYRDYFLEKIEHIFDSMVTPSAYPKLSLGPNQRYASKGSYIVRLAQGPNGELSAVSDWIVP